MSKNKKAQSVPLFLCDDRTKEHQHFTRLYDSLLFSRACHSLNARQFKLLVYVYSTHRNHRTDLQRRIYGEKYATENYFFFSWRVAQSIGYTNKSTFYADMSRLVQVGFIRVAVKQPQKRTLYAYSESWKVYAD